MNHGEHQYKVADAVSKPEDVVGNIGLYQVFAVSVAKLHCCMPSILNESLLTARIFASGGNGLRWSLRYPFRFYGI